MTEKKKYTFDERVEFVAKHYQADRLNEEKAWQSFAAKHHVSRSFRLPTWIWQAAAVVLLLLGFGTYYIFQQQQPDWVLIAAAPDQVKEVCLPDSSFVTLSAASELRYDAKSYGKEQRHIEMKGKAFYKVKHQEDCPFQVSTKASQVTVLGTSFLVREWQQDVEVQVLTGRVRFEAGKDLQVLLKAGMSARYSEADRQILTSQQADENCLSWKSRELVFREADLAKVIHDLEVCYNVRIENRKASGDSLRLTATFKQMPLKDVLSVINQTLDIRLKIKE